MNKEFVSKLKGKVSKLNEKNFEIILLTITVLVGAFVFFVKKKLPVEDNLFVLLSFIWFFLFPIRNLYLYNESKKKQVQENERTKK